MNGLDDIILNNYYININYIYSKINNITKNSIKKNHKKDPNIINHELIKDCICHLIKIKEYVYRGNRDAKLHMTLIDDFIFSIYANIYILSDIIKFNNIINSLSFNDIIKFDNPLLKKNTCIDNTFTIQNFLITTKNNDMNYITFFISFLQTVYPESLININKASTTLYDLWKYYIREHIIKNFNKSIYKSTTQESKTNILLFNIIHILTCRGIDNLIDFTDIDLTSKIKDNPFEYFNCFINRINIIKCINDTDYTEIIKYIKYLFKFSSISTTDIIEYCNNPRISLTQYHNICWFI